MLKKVEIHQDSNMESPREECDNFGTIAYKHSRYCLGEEYIDDPVDWLLEKIGINNDQAYSLAKRKGINIYSNEFRKYLENRFSKEFVWLPVYLYDHSGITISTSTFSCPWDSGQVGYIFVSKAKVREEYSNLNSTWRKEYHKGKGIMQIAKSVLEGEIKTFDQYLRGDVYGFKILDVTNNEEIDSCWGFYGDDWENNGIKEYIPDELHYQLKNIEITY